MITRASNGLYRVNDGPPVYTEAQAVAVDEAIFRWSNATMPGWYRWSTMKDDKVRTLHADLEGGIFSLAEPSPDPLGHAGEPYNCRCKQESVRRRDLTLSTRFDSLRRRAMRMLKSVAGRMMREGFNPNQPRDGHGRWTTGGRGLGSGGHPTYYDVKPGMTTADVQKRWQKGDEKASGTGSFDTDDVWKHREYTWTRDTSRPGVTKVDGKMVDLTGPKKWDAIKDDMRQNGWSKSDPAIVFVGKTGMKVGEGNHRLAIARELGIKKVPVRFEFRDGAVTKSKLPANKPKKAPAKRIEPPKPKPPAQKLTPAQQAKKDRDVDQIMKLLFF